jgi:hypothetical protein
MSTASFVLLGLVSGMVLGERYNVLILVPASLLVWIAVIGMEISRTEETWTIVLLGMAVTAALQVGYLIGSISSLVIRARAPG